MKCIPHGGGAAGRARGPLVPTARAREQKITAREPVERAIESLPLQLSNIRDVQTLLYATKPAPTVESDPLCPPRRG